MTHRKNSHFVRTLKCVDFSIYRRVASLRTSNVEQLTPKPDNLNSPKVSDPQTKNSFFYSREVRAYVYVGDFVRE